MASRHNDLSSTGRLNDGFKQRIVGALVLIALGVIFLPSLFDREGARYIDMTSQIPPAPDIQPIEIAAPQPVEGIAPAPEAGAIFQPQPVSEQQPSAAPAPQAVASAPTTTPATAASPQSAPAVTESVLDERGLPRAWVVQVASYREQAQADALRDRLMDAGYKAYTRSASTAKGDFVRVFVGPKVERGDAEAVKRELDQLLSAQTLVMRLK
ncbi:cell division protein DedD [Microbulbifer aestuariivivens]|uniref:Cell division protein DedD n=1 Tax=Microbulbifer aestuariivivens TaxID=1908308 RepID=A0ABP9WNG8_9GAMM